jgi:hypothetical protein
MYITLFDTLADQITFLNQLPRWEKITPFNKALIAGLVIIAATLLLVAAALYLNPYPFLIVLGVIYGAFISRLLAQFLAPKLQSVVTGFVGGVTTGNVASKTASLRSVIASLGKSIQNLVISIRGLPELGASFGDAVVWAVWTALFTVLVILAANAHYANLESSRVGNPTGQ